MSPEAEHKSATRLDATHASISEAVGQAVAARTASQGSRDRIEILVKEAPAPAMESSTDRVIAGIMPFLICGACLGDWILALPTASWVTYSLIGDPALLAYTRVLFPLSTIFVDFTASTLRYQALREINTGKKHQDPRLFLAWGLICIWMCLSIATQCAVSPGDDATRQHTYSFWFKAVGLVGFTFICHSLIVFCGRAVFESLAYWIFLVRKSSLERARERSDMEFTRHSQDAVTRFANYLEERRIHVNRFGHSPNHNFNGATRQVLRDHLGYDPIQIPGGGTASDVGPQRPSVPSQESADPLPSQDPGNEEYYRRIVEDQMKKEETEIRA
jgi:hypothetical protein